MKHNIMTQNILINNVKNRFKSIIDGILIRYDNYIYYKQLERFFKNNRTVLEKLKDKVNLAIACLNKNISKYNTNGILDGRPHSIWLDSLVKGQLRRSNRNSKK
jgi:hypothetical protein